ncbi:MAG: NAD(P)-dependent oxidoreductase [Sphingomonadales bacterium]
MSDPQQKAAEIRTNRLSPEQYAENFADMHPPLDRRQAAVEADRCYFCHDAPCIEACPTGIDIPSFIHKISTGNVRGSARTILEENIFGAICARVCPTEMLCEQSCVRNCDEHKPVTIGALQRYATDNVLESGTQLFTRGPDTGKTIAVVGGGPAGVSCAHRLALMGHKVVIFEAAEKLGGLNEYGLAAYKVVDEIARREMEYILAIGGIEVRHGKALGRDFTLDDLRGRYDAVFLGMGLGGVNQLGLESEDIEGVHDAVDYIAQIRQARDLGTLPVGRRIVVIGGGMTAIDIAVQTKGLGAEDVMMAYRRGAEHMGASELECDLAQTNGVKIKHWAAPIRLLSRNGRVSGVEFEYTRLDDNGRLGRTGETFTVEADMVFKAIGQRFLASDLDGAAEMLELDRGRIAVDENRRSSLDDVWAGGDCVAGGEDLTVAAVQDGKIAAQAIDRYLSEQN